MNQPSDNTPANSGTVEPQKHAGSVAPAQRAARKTPVKAVVKSSGKVSAPVAKKAPPKARAKPVAKPSAKAPEATVTAAKEKKTKMVRDSFTFPKPEYEQLAALKERALALGVSVKKGELLRCGLAMLVASTDKSFKASIATLPKIKAGRPGK